MKLIVIKFLIHALFVLQVLSVILCAAFGMVSLFSALGSLIVTIHPVEIPSNLQIYTNAGFALVMLLGALIIVIVYFWLDYSRKGLKDELK